MKSKLIIILFLFISISASVLAQILKGKVYDATSNKPLSGAAIKFAGKGGTTTDKDGMFSIDCNVSKEITVFK